MTKNYILNDLTISFSSLRSLEPLSVKTTINDLADAFCRATSRPYNNTINIKYKLHADPKIIQ